MKDSSTTGAGGREIYPAPLILKGLMMKAATFFTLCIEPTWRAFQRWVTQKNIDGWKRDIEFLAARRENDRKATDILRNEIVQAQIALIDLQ